MAGADVDEGKVDAVADVHVDADVDADADAGVKIDVGECKLEFDAR